MSHTASNQAWQVGADSGELANLETGEGIPAWALKIEGRLLEVCRPHVIYDCRSQRV
jgi:SWI/SNF-related matrix-associated actin-dependent regulator of chromatin subfamily D